MHVRVRALVGNSFAKNIVHFDRCMHALHTHTLIHKQTASPSAFVAVVVQCVHYSRASSESRRKMANAI